MGSSYDSFSSPCQREEYERAHIGYQGRFQLWLLTSFEMMGAPVLTSCTLYRTVDDQHS